MEDRLKPMGIREYLDYSFSIMREKFWAMQAMTFKAFLPSLIIFILGCIVAFVYILIIGSTNHIPFTDERFWTELFKSSLVSTILMIILLVVLLLAFLVATFIGGIYFCYGNIRFYQCGFHDQKISSKEAFEGIKGKRLRFFLSWILFGIISYIIAIPGIFVNMFVSMMNPIAGFIVSLVVNLISFVVSVFFLLTPVIITCEDLDVISSMKRAFMLIAKYRWKVFFTQFLVVILYYALFFLSFGFIGIAVALAVNAFMHHLVLLIPAFLLCILGLLFLGIMIPYYVGPLTAIYYDMLIRKEGYDLKLKIENKLESVT